MYDIQQSTTSYELLFLMIDSADHVTGKTGLSPTVTIRKSAGSFGSPSGSVSEIANGWYKVAGNATDSGTLGPLLLHATSAGADPCDTVYNVVAYNPQDAVRLGLTALPNAAAEAAGGLVTNGTGTGQLSVSSGQALVRAGTGTGQIDLSSGQVKVQSGTGSGQLDVTSGQVKVQSGTGAGQILNASGQVTVGTNNDKTGYSLSSAGVDAILDEAITEPATVFDWASATLRNIIGWLGALASNRTTQTVTTQVLRDRANTTNIATCTVSDDGTTFVRGSYA